MTPDLKQILNKKKLTGEEVGKALVSNAIAILKSAKIVDGQYSVKGLFTDTELNTMVKGLNTSQDVTCYDGYREVLNTVRHLITKLKLVRSEYETSEWQALYIFSNCFQAEFNNASKIHTPLIITKELFEAEKQKELAEMENWNISHVEIAIDVILYFYNLYKEKPRAKNPFKNEFDKLKAKEASENKRKDYEKAYCVSYYYETSDGKRSDEMASEEWQSYVEQYEVFTTNFIPSSKHPIDPIIFSAGLNKIKNNEPTFDDILELLSLRIVHKINPLERGLSEFEYLSLLDDYFKQSETNEDINAFLKEYMPLIEIAVNYMNNSKALQYESQMTVPAMRRKELIRDLAKSNFLNYANWYNIKEPKSLSCLYAGYAILQGEDIKFPKTVLSYDSFLISDDGAVVKAIMNCTDNLKQSYIRANAIHCFLDLISKEIDAPELMDVIGQKINPTLIEQLNDIGDDIKRNIIRYSGFLRHDKNATAKALAIFETVFTRIHIDRIEPTEKAKEEAFELIHSRNDLYDKQERIISILEGGHN